jgi:hypothetical protein
MLYNEGHAPEVFFDRRLDPARAGRFFAAHLIRQHAAVAERLGERHLGGKISGRGSSRRHRQLQRRRALALFLPSTGAAIDISVHLNAIVLFGVVRATGAVMAPLCMLIASLWLVRVPFAFLMLERWHADAIRWSFPFSSIVSALLASWYYRYGGWRNVRLGIAEKRAASPPAGDPEIAAATSMAAPTSTGS